MACLITKNITQEITLILTNNVTSVSNPDKERLSRMRLYSLSMGIRLICIGLCFIVPGWFVTLPILGAIVLPWFAVIGANTKTITNNSVESPHRGAIIKA